MSSEFVPLSALSPIEAALSIEKIRNSIFSLLEPPDLLRCRLVSSSWLRIATNKKLLNWNKNGVVISFYLKRNKHPAVTVNDGTKKLKDFTDVIDGMENDSHPFLYSTKINWEMPIAPNDYFKFFDHYGYDVNSLNVTFKAKEKGEFFVYHKDSLMEFLTKVLTEQMPYLETLKVEFEEDTKFEGEIDKQQLASIKNELQSAGKQNENLRTVEVWGQAPYEIIEILCTLAPKLDELLLHDSWGFWANNKHRLNLLKTFLFRPSVDHWEEVDALETIVNSEDKIDFKKFMANFGFVRNNALVWPRLARLFTKVYEKSCDSLEELDLHPIYFLPLTILPPMPKVKVISLNAFFCLDALELGFLPPATSIVTTFPSLHTINFHWTVSVTDFLSLCQDEVVESVKVIITHKCEIDENVFRERFPNAVITKLS